MAMEKGIWMIQKLAIDLANIFVHDKIIDSKEFQIHVYGLELLLSATINFVFVFIISIIFHVFTETLLFLAAFIPLRTIAGGFHAQTHRNCILLFTIVYFLFAWLIPIIPPIYLVQYILFAGFISTILIWKYAPVETENKPLSDKEKVVLRKKSLILSGFNLLVSIAGIRFSNLRLAFYVSGILAAAVSLLVAKKWTMICKTI
jgi:accessory gene regulator B